MTTLATDPSPRTTPTPTRKQASGIRMAPALIVAAQSDVDQVLAQMQTTAAGLSQAEAAVRLEAHGPNEIGQEKHQGWSWRLWMAVRNPLAVLLAILCLVNLFTPAGDFVSGVVIGLMMLVSVGLRFVQETRADNAAAKLKAMIRVTATVVREGQTAELPLREIVAGDIIRLSAGDMIPADVRLLSCKDLFVIQSSLTGESMPVEKSESKDTRADVSPQAMCNICFLGTSVESGTATAVVVATGPQTYFGSMARSIVGVQVQTSFDRGVSGFTWLMIKFMVVMVPAVFLINWYTKHDIKDAMFFSLAVAVGITPEMLPMIVAVSLSKGAMLMSRKKVIVKRLNSIQNFGAMDVLCSDKTGTLTLDRVILEQHCDVVGQESDSVLEAAYLISFFQTGLKNVLDRAILQHAADVRKETPVDKYKKVDELPFDLTRRMMSVVVQDPEGKHTLLCKGAPEEVYGRCTRFELNDEVLPMEQLLIDDLREEYMRLSADGFRVLAVARRDMEPRATYAKADETDLVLIGYVAFLDPPKESAAEAINALKRHGVDVKILTGDNDLVSKKVCREVGLNVDGMLVGKQVEQMSDEELGVAAEKTTLFARVSPADKQRIIKALQAKGHVVGYLGDGINDAPALRAADVGISVEAAVDIAKESADVILLEKSLMVLEDGVIEGRKVFANILKYIRMGASSNFGNMFSVLGASAFLPFLPMEPIQVLTNNLLYDFSQVPIPTDNVDPEQVSRPRPWRIDEIRRFILFIGPISSIFDYSTYFVMLYMFHCWDKPHVFQTGWFIESLLTQTLIIYIIRSNKIPFIQSMPSWPLMATSALIMAVGIYLPFSPVGHYLQFGPLPGMYWPVLVVTIFAYVLLTQIIKAWLAQRKFI